MREPELILEVPELIRTARAAAGLTQRQLAAAAGTSQAAVARCCSSTDRSRFRWRASVRVAPSMRSSRWLTRSSILGRSTLACAKVAEIRLGPGQLLTRRIPPRRPDRHWWATP